MPLVLIGWRVALLLFMAIAPWAAPLEATLERDLRVQIGCGFAVCVLFIALIARRFETRSRKDAVGWLLMASLICSAIVALALPRNAWPLSMGSVVVAVPLWAAVVIWVRQAAAKSVVLKAVPIVFFLGSWLIGGGRVLQRESVWRKTIEENPQWVVAHHALLDVLDSRSAPEAGRDAVALVCAERLPNDQRCLLLAVRIALRRRDWDRVLELTRIGLLARDSDRMLLEARSAALHELGRSDAQSITEQQRAYGANPTNIQLRRNVATALQAANRFREALQVLQREPVPEDEETQQLLTAVAIQTEDWAIARRAAMQVISVEPENVKARFNLGVIEQRTGHFNAAREAYLRVLRADSRHFAARYNLARLVFEVGATDEALHHAQRLLEIDARDVRVRDLMREIQDRIFARAADGGSP